MEAAAAVCVMTSQPARRACAEAATRVAVFPACLFPAEAMAEVKACVFYGSKSHIVPPFNEPSPSARPRSVFRPNYSGPVVESAAKWTQG